MCPVLKPIEKSALLKTHVTHTHSLTHTRTHIHKYIRMNRSVNDFELGIYLRGAFNKFPDFFRMGI